MSARGKKDIRRERDQFLGVAAREIGIVTSPAQVNMNIAALGPTEFLM